MYFYAYLMKNELKLRNHDDLEIYHKTRLNRRGAELRCVTYRENHKRARKMWRRKPPGQK